MQHAYFAIDETVSVQMCKRKSNVTIFKNVTKSMPIVEKICLKYVGKLDDPFSQMMLDETKGGTSVVLELAPKFYSTWDFSKE